jgi:hypothetical protein
MNAINTTAQTLLVNIEDGYPLFKAVSYDEAHVLRQSGEWASYLFKTMKYSLDGTVLTLYHTSPAHEEEVSPYFKPSTELLEKMAECQALLTPARVLSESIGVTDGVYHTTRNFDSQTVRPRSVGIFSPLLNKAEVDGYSETTIDLKEVDPAELSGYFEGRGYPQGVNLHNFFEVERDHVVSFLRQIRRKVVN